MVMIIVESVFPHNKSTEAGKKWLEVVEKYPPDRNVSKQIMVAVRVSKKGIVSIAAWDVKNGKEKEALIAMGEAMMMFSEIEGYRYSIKTYMSAAETMNLLGLKAPEG